MIEEFTLNAGEALYVPRGMMHAATTTDETSLHITLGVLTYTWADLLIDCISEITERSAAWREDLPPGFYRPKVQSELQDSFKKLLEGLPEEMDLPLVTKERQLRFEGHHRPRITDNLNQAMQASSLKETDAVKWRSETAASIEIRGERIVLQNGNTREIEFPITARKTLEILLSENPLAIKEIDDGLDWPSRKIVLEKLIREGLLSNESIR
jgi:ribosomal protein L16 Arg81 hydroxylase